MLWLCLAALALPAAAKVLVADAAEASALEAAASLTTAVGSYSFVSTIRISVAATSTAATTNSAGSTSSLTTTFTTTSPSPSLVTLHGKTTTTLSASNSTAISHRNSTSTSTSSSASSTPTINTRPCNGYAEFCNRRYSDITMIGSHNSFFIRRGNIATNQVVPVPSQLDDGIRYLNIQTHFVNNTLYACHTSCQLLNVGTLTSRLEIIGAWVRTHPYDVVTIGVENGDYIAPGNFSQAFKDAGLLDLVWTPPRAANDSAHALQRPQWPSLSSFILSGKRIVVFLDYQADERAYPWLLNEFTHMSETPFDPTDQHFPCTVQRPPGLSIGAARQRLLLANHNLNVRVDLSLASGSMGKSSTLLIPDITQLDATNAASGFGSLGRMAAECNRTYGMRPNVLLVDYYNYGRPNGSVFEVAAAMNNVTYNPSQCCGKTSAATKGYPALTVTLVTVAGVLLGWLL